MECFDKISCSGRCLPPKKQVFFTVCLLLLAGALFFEPATFANGQGACCGGGGGGGGGGGAPSSPHHATSAEESPLTAAPVSFLFPLKVGFSTWFMYNEVFSIIKNKAYKTVASSATRMLRRREQPHPYAIVSQWFRGLILQLTGVASSPKGPGGYVQLQRTSMNGPAVAQLAEDFETIGLTAWRYLGPDAKSAVCDVNDEECRQKVEDVLYSTISLFWSTVLSAQGPSTLQANFRKLLEQSACPLFAYSDPGFLESAVEQGPSNFSGLEDRLDALGRKYYKSEACVRFRDSMLAGMNVCGVTLQEQVEKLKQAKEGHSAHSLHELLMMNYDKMSIEAQFYESTLLTSVRGEAARHQKLSPEQKLHTLVSAVAAAKKEMDPLSFAQFLERTESGLRAAGELTTTMEEMVAVAKRDEESGAADRRRAAKKDCCKGRN